MKVFFVFLILIIPVLELTTPKESFAQSTQCLGTTKKGEQCKRMTKSSSGYCYQHEGQAKTGSKKTDSTSPKSSKSSEETVTPVKSSKSAESTQCQATTKKGKQCSRKAKAGSSYCWQHGG